MQLGTLSLSLTSQKVANQDLNQNSKFLPLNLLAVFISFFFENLGKQLLDFFACRLRKNTGLSMSMGAVAGPKCGVPHFFVTMVPQPVCLY